MKYLYLLQQALIWLITIYWAYQIVVSFCSLIKLKDKKLIIEKDHKFMAIIPAHNEENVIKNLVESLKAQNYPEELYDRQAERPQNGDGVHGKFQTSELYVRAHIPHDQHLHSGGRG